MNRMILALTTLTLAACSTGTGPTTSIRNETGASCVKCNDTGEACTESDTASVDPDCGAPAIVLSAIELRFLGQPEDLEDLRLGPMNDTGLPTDGAYGASILGGDLDGAVTPGKDDNGLPALDGTDVELGSEIECGVYDVKFTASGNVCEMTEMTGLGPLYLCFSHQRWVVGDGLLGDCRDIFNPPME
jgi:hypothetical protein